MSLVMILCGTIVSAKAEGQAMFASSSDRVCVYSLPYLQSWKLENEGSEKNISQFGMPVFVLIKPIDNLSFWFIDSVSSAELDGNHGEEIRLGGFSDAKAKFSYSMFDQSLLVTLGLNLPVGKAELSQNHMRIADLLYNEALGFKVNKLGSGFDVNAGMALVLDLGPLGLSIAPNYLRRGSYTALKDSDLKYKPGDEFWIVTALDAIGDSAELKSDLAYIHYGPDRVDGEEKLKQGDEIIGRVFITYRAEPVVLIFSAVNAIRMKNHVLSESGNLILEEKNSNGNKLDANITGRYFITRSLSVSSSTGAAFLSKNGYGEESAFIWNVGAGIRFSTGNNVSFDYSIRMLKGSMENGDLNVSGLELGAILAAKF